MGSSQSHLTKTMLAGKNKGFSLLELLGVIAIIAVLLAIILPLTRGVSDAALRAKTKTQFSQYALALERYRQTYGHFPEFLNKGEPVAIQGSEAIDFIMALSVQDLIAGSHARRFRWNPEAISFYQFSENELVRAQGKVVGIADAQGEESIFILVDKEGRGVLRRGLPRALLDAVSGQPVEELVASILIFSKPEGGGRSVCFYE